MSTEYGVAKLDDDLRRFLHDVEYELHRARDKFPSAAGSMCALMEEVGELAKAMLDEPRWRVYAEAVQVAVMAARVCLEGDATMNHIRNNRGADGPTAAPRITPPEPPSPPPERDVRGVP